MKLKKYIWIIGSAVAVFVVLVVLMSGNGEKDTGAGFSVSKVSRGNLRSTVSATGNLSPLITVQVGSQVSGRIEKLLVDYNSKVKKGQVIAQIEPSVFKARLAEAEANLESANAEYNKAKVAVEDAKRTLARLRSLRKRNLVSAAALDVARFNFESKSVDLQVKKAAITKAQAVRDREKVNLDYTTIYAPIDGVVISRDVDVGQTVAASLQAPTLITIAQDLTKMQIETDVDEAFIGQIRKGQRVRFTVFAYPKRVFRGRIAQIRLQPKVEAGVVKYNCIVHVANDDLALKPGMTATATIVVASKRDVLKVPNAALRFVPSATQGWPGKRLNRLRKTMKPGQGIIWQVKGDRFTPLMVSTGIIGARETEITSSGIKKGIEIAVPPKRGKTRRRRRFGLRVF